VELKPGNEHEPRAVGNIRDFFNSVFMPTINGAVHTRSDLCNSVASSGSNTIFQARAHDSIKS
jgi:hypothetical protein